MHPKHNILGIQISSISMSNLLDDFAVLIRSSSKASVCITPVNSILATRKNAQVLAIYNNANYTLCDGVPVLWASRFLGTPIEQRITGLDLLPALLEFCATNNFSLFFLGASPGVGNALKAKAEELHTSINIKGVYCPPFAAKFEKAENDKMIAAINAVKPDIVLVSLTAPKQDIWISENLEYLDTKIAIGIGGAFEVTAGLINRAPVWMQKASLEWFYRFTQEPKRMFKRYFIEAPVFIPLVILQKLRGGR
ncbi:MAG: glycosyltransferase [Chitinophagia bacterium]|nr:glycosyltransferase [Chitinophagia bacterium]